MNFATSLYPCAVVPGSKPGVLYMFIYLYTNIHLHLLFQSTEKALSLEVFFLHKKVSCIELINKGKKIFRKKTVYTVKLNSFLAEAKIVRASLNTGTA